MYDQSKLSELIRFARVDAGAATLNEPWIAASRAARSSNAQS